MSPTTLPDRVETPGVPHEHTETVYVVGCYDGRLADGGALEALGEACGHASCFFRTAAGGAKEFSDPLRRGNAVDELATALVLRNGAITDIFLTVHEDCGRLALDGDTRDLPQIVDDAIGFVAVSLRRRSAQLAGRGYQSLRIVGWVHELNNARWVRTGEQVVAIRH